MDVQQELADVVAELERRGVGRDASALGNLFPQQQAFIEDTARSKAALCTRRAGKTYMACSYLLREAFAAPGTMLPYVALTRGHAKRLLWPELHRFNERYKLGLSFDTVDLTATTASGSTIWLVGADDSRKVERLRGDKYKLVIIDEAGSFPNRVIEYMLLDVIEPALIDLRGTLCMIGTPTPVPTGTFYEATRERLAAEPASPYSVHRWSILDNPHIEEPARAIEEIKAKYGWGNDNPRFRREYRGEWVRDTDSVVYRYDRARNYIELQPEPDSKAWIYVLGVDYGVKDATAFAIIGWRRHKPNETYLIESWGRSGMLSHEAAAEVEKLMQKYNPAFLVGDEGGMGKLYQEELRRRFAIPIKAAQKTSKRGFIELMNGDILDGRFKVVGPACKEWIDEAMVCQWDDDHLHEDDNYSNHRLDAALYAWRESRAYSESVLPGAKSLEAQEDDRIKRIEQRMKRQAQPGVSQRGRRY